MSDRRIDQMLAEMAQVRRELYDLKRRKSNSWVESSKETQLVRVKNFVGRNVARHRGFRLGVPIVPAPSFPGITESMELDSTVFQLVPNTDNLSRQVAVTQTALADGEEGMAAISGRTLIKVDGPSGIDADKSRQRHCTPKDYPSDPDRDGQFEFDQGGGELLVLNPHRSSILTKCLAVFQPTGVWRSDWTAFLSNLTTPGVDTSNGRGKFLQTFAHGFVGEVLQPPHMGISLTSSDFELLISRGGTYRVTVQYSVQQQFSTDLTILDSIIGFQVFVGSSLSRGSVSTLNTVRPNLSGFNTRNRTGVLVDWCRINAGSTVRVNCNAQYAAFYPSTNSSALLPNTGLNINGQIALELISPRWSLTDLDALTETPGEPV